MIRAEDYKDDSGLFDGRLVARMPLGGQSSVMVAVANLPADGSEPRIALLLGGSTLSLKEAIVFSRVYASLLASVHRRINRASAVAGDPTVASSR